MEEIPDDDAGTEQHRTRTYTEVFEEVFPYYLSLGMTYNQFWRDDPRIVKYYRQAEKIRKERINSELWLQGMYVYEAICDAAPIFNPFAKHGVRPRPYPTEPYPLTKTEKTKAEKVAEEKKQMDKAQRIMDAYASRVNRNVANKAQQEVKHDG